MQILNTPLSVNGLTLRNRLVMAPMATAKSTPDGAVTPDLCDYYAARAAAGGLGLIITEHAYILPEGKAAAGQLSIGPDCDPEGLRRLTDAVHHAGNTALFVQISHAGGAAKPAVTGLPARAPSAVRFSASPVGEMLQGETVPAPDLTALTEADIQQVVQAFAQAALRAKEAGFDGVELHSAHGYLLNQFYSPLLNRRTDRYNGQTLAGRIALHLEVIRAVRETVGKDYPLALRLGACDYAPGGSTAEDSAAAAVEFEKAGVDLLDISGGVCSYRRPGHTEPGYFAGLSRAVRQAVSIPVLVTGGITEGDQAEALLEAGDADLIGVGRALLQDSGWAAAAVQALR